MKNTEYQGNLSCPQLTPIYEPLFSDDSFGYRPGRSAQMAILRVKAYAEQRYTQAVLVDLSKYFDTLNHELLMNLLRKNIHLEAVEAPQNESKEPCKTWNAPVAGLQERKLSEGILGNCRKRYSHKDHYK